ncbi:MAG: phage head closure protein [Ktedonobacterales bacterium]
MANTTWTPSGERRRRVTIQQQNSATRTGMGFLTNAWTDVLTTWAKVTPRQLTALVTVGASQEPIIKNTYAINIRYAPSITILPGMRVTDGSSYYLIQSVTDVQERRRELNLMCSQIPAPAAMEQ